MGIQLTEPVVVPDVYACGLGGVEDLGEGIFRFTFYSRQINTYDGVGTDNVIVARMVMPIAAIMKGIQTTMIATGVGCCGGERIKKLHH